MKQMSAAHMISVWQLYCVQCSVLIVAAIVPVLD